MAVNYVAEYSGVKGSVITDHDGLVVAYGPAVGMDSELYAAQGLEIVNSINKSVAKLVKPGCSHISIKTDQDWITIAHTCVFYLIVAADKQADDLLNVRIQRALEMISSHVKEKYPTVSTLTKPVSTGSKNNLEASHV